MAENHLHNRNDRGSSGLGTSILASFVVIVLVLLGGLYFVQSDRGTMATGPSVTEPATTGQGGPTR